MRCINLDVQAIFSTQQYCRRFITVHVIEHVSALGFYTRKRTAVLY
jgi:hypothetical protein